MRYITNIIITLIFMSISSAYGTGLNMSDEVLRILENIEQNVMTINRIEKTNEINEIIKKNPENIYAHYVLGKLLFRLTGDIEKANFYYDNATRLLSSIDIETLSNEKQTFYSNISEGIRYDQNDIDDYFGKLRFKIQSVQITKLCRIEDVNVEFQYSDVAYNDAYIDQRKRLDFLKQKLKNVNFQFSEWDSTENEMFFTIPFFPIISTAISEPYTMTINNERRFHFDYFGDTDSFVEIKWDDKYKLVESLPNNYIGIVHSEKLSFKPKYPTGVVVTGKPFSLEDFDPQKKITYYPVIHEQNIDLYLNDNYPGKLGEQFFNTLTYLSIITVISGSFIIVR